MLRNSPNDWPMRAVAWRSATRPAAALWRFPTTHRSRHGSTVAAPLPIACKPGSRRTEGTRKNSPCSIASAISLRSGFLIRFMKRSAISSVHAWMPCGLASSVSPSAEADWRRPDVLDLSDQQQRIVDAKINAVIVAQLRIIQPRPGSIPIEDRCGYSTIVSQIGPQAGVQRRQRRRRSATGQIDRRDGRPAHRGVGKHVGIFGVDELGISGELASPQRQRGSHFCSNQISYNRVDGNASMPFTTKILQIAARKPVAMNLKHVGMKRKLSRSDQLFASRRQPRD